MRTICALLLPALLATGCISHHTTHRVLPRGRAQHQFAMEAVRANNDTSPAYTYRYRRGLNDRVELHLGLHSFDISAGYKLKLLKHLALLQTVRTPIDGVGLNPGFDVSLITGYRRLYGGAGFARFWALGRNPGQNIVPNRSLYGIFAGLELPLNNGFRLYPELTLDFSDTGDITGAVGVAAGFGRIAE